MERTQGRHIRERRCLYLGGIGAAYLKIAADSRQEAYLATGDPALASERRRLDTMAGVSLALAQAGIIVLSYLLITE